MNRQCFTTALGIVFFTLAVSAFAADRPADQMKKLVIERGVVCLCLLCLLFGSLG